MAQGLYIGVGEPRVFVHLDHGQIMYCSHQATSGSTGFAHMGGGIPDDFDWHIGHVDLQALDAFREVECLNMGQDGLKNRVTVWFLPTFGEAGAPPQVVPAPPPRPPRGAHVRARVVGRARSGG